ncbi:hypothetical protein PHLGIDRAFT_110417 [Phlebiopsis gigantea 11061_1 CR5-6]|uniref:Protein-S-isoprenylcysteine O-methyltransferase n=1 Tax=Phlebiopsis gigantea (strain 11061_1 CR5-6) TaxID=745531 RepID=A0A0C3PEA1_PHLG1|nr:hypothetical protein PHLGIDRAFT_110417 [Phlebiopsis gigantea 11061_1 CR5-6]
MDAVLFKAATLVLCAVLFHNGIHPPTPPPARENIVYKGQLFEHASRGLIYFWQGLFFVTAGCHIAVMCALQNTALDARFGITSALCSSRTPPSLRALASFSPRFAAGVLIMVLAAALRMWCYRTLGRLFTFEVAISPDHALITRGPYAWVRHPSYTGGIAMVLATALLGFGPREYVAQCGVAASRAGVLVLMWCVPAVYGVWALYRRTGVEDAKLREKFGEVWEKYRREVPHKLIPYVV